MGAEKYAPAALGIAGENQHPLFAQHNITYQKKGFPEVVIART